MKNPWLDFASYQYSDSYRFKGRDKDIAKFKVIMDNGTMSVLYAESGIGKTSFINAGIEPEYVKKGYFPIHILFNEDTFNSNIDVERWLISDIESKFYEVIKGSDSEEGYKRKVKGWHYNYADTCSEIEKLHNNLWWRLHAYKVRNLETGEILKPLVVFDQFEEVFVKGREGFLNSLFSILEQVSSTTLPDSVSCVLDEIEEFEYFEIDRQHFFKILFSLRKDFLSDFDYWSNDKKSITELFQNRMLLKALSREQAKQVICNQDGIDTLDEVANEILEKIDDKHHDAVEPFILSVFCSRLFEKAVSLKKEILKKEDLAQINIKNIIQSFYEEKILALIPNQEHRVTFETALVDEDGFRKRERIESRNLKRIGFEEKYAESLENSHLIRKITVNDVKCVEIVHDRIAEVISERNKQRESERQAAREKAEAERRQRELEDEIATRKKYIIVISRVSLLLFAFAAFTVMKWHVAVEAEKAAVEARNKAQEAFKKTKTAWREAEEARSRAEASERKAIEEKYRADSLYRNLANQKSLTKEVQTDLDSTQKNLDKTQDILKNYVAITIEKHDSITNLTNQYNSLVMDYNKIVPQYNEWATAHKKDCLKEKELKKR